MNIVDSIKRSNAGREPERLALKYLAMHGNPFAFLRGTCGLFYERLPRGAVKAAPPVWVCGDLHLENFGSYKGDNRLVYFDLNDFDEAALAPASWDLVRFMTSVLIAADGLHVDAAAAQSLCTRFLQSYCAALTQGKAYWIERETARGLVRDLLDKVRGRDRGRFLASRVVAKGTKRRLLIDGKKALVASPAQRARVDAFMADFAQTQPNPPFFEVLDVARRIAGTGSLGVDRYAVLVNGKGSPNGNYLLDLKQALPSSLAPRLKIPQPAWQNEAERVVGVQRRAQAVSMAFLHAVRMEKTAVEHAGDTTGGVAYVLRALQPTEDRIVLGRERQSLAGWTEVVATMGSLAAWSHLRSAGRGGSAIADELLAFGRRPKWPPQLLDVAHACATQTRKDAAAFDAAFSDGAFAL